MRKLVLALAIALAAPLLNAQSVGGESVPPDVSPAAELSVVDAIVLGMVEGVTEFLPISSTGHLIIATRFLHLESDKPLTGRDGRPLWHRKPSPTHPQGEPLTLKLGADTYTVVIQFGAIAAVALLYWSQFMAMLRGLLGRDPAGRRLLINVTIAFLPAAVIGLLAHRWISDHLFSVGNVIIAQVAGAGLMFYAEWWRRRRAGAPATPASAGHALDDLTPAAAAGIGVLQCFAMWPGTSRSMMTIVGGYFAGLDPRRSAEFSFLLGFVTLTAASAFKTYKSGGAMIQVFGWPHVLLGAVVAAVTAALCVRFLVHWLARHGLAAFAWYRIVTAAALAIVFYL
ncbi:MAG: undecaprenyl-diphosphate phosphatase [Verrucomicrobia bacterium]|nr:undecaprenyl-diphosphate phosphatase [Verrucomicrobiota bacterium]